MNFLSDVQHLKYVGMKLESPFEGRKWVASPPKTVL